LAKHRLFDPVGNGVVADPQQPFGGALANPFEILSQGGGLFFGRHQATVFFSKGLLAFLTPPALVSMAGGSILNTGGCVAVRTVHAKTLPHFSQHINTYLAIPDVLV